MDFCKIGILLLAYLAPIVVGLCPIFVVPILKFAKLNLTKITKCEYLFGHKKYKVSSSQDHQSTYRLTSIETGAQHRLRTLDLSND
jgi:hypothetical protein